MRISASTAAPGLNPCDVDLFSPEFYATGDPHPVWAVMRASAPLHRQELPDGRSFLSITRYHDACRVLGDAADFTSERGSLLHQLGQGDAAAGQMLVSTDPPRHSELRRPLNRPMSAKSAAALEDTARRAVATVLAPAMDGEVWEVAGLADHLPVALAGALLGLPERDWPDLARWTAMAAAPDEPSWRIRSGSQTLAIAHHSLFDYFARQLRRRRDSAADDLISHLMTMSAGAERLSDDEVIYNCYSLLLGANATTPHAVAGTILALIEHPDQWRLAPDAVGTLVEEGLRWTSPASSFLRHAVTDVELSGGVVRRGEAVAVWIGAANRDERVFPEPYRFDITRANNRHIAFGFGPHYCLGASVARMTLRVFFDELIRRFDTIELAGPVEHLASAFIAGYIRLPVRTRTKGKRRDR
ncbi:cytochrome P450 [Actinophytocola sp.]|uniref:cytochrome P450 n=1 Tax=Actinophytocola sp. TaxID=1872138 RepID=UPI003D6A31CB